MTPYKLYEDSEISVILTRPDSILIVEMNDGVPEPQSCVRITPEVIRHIYLKLQAMKETREESPVEGAPHNVVMIDKLTLAMEQLDRRIVILEHLTDQLNKSINRAEVAIDQHDEWIDDLVNKLGNFR